MYYKYSQIDGRYQGTSFQDTGNCTILAPPHLSTEWYFVADEISGVWVHNLSRSKVYGVIAFKLRFTIAEIIRINTAALSDPIIRSLLDILNDSRTLEVDCNIPFIVEGINYLETAGLLDNTGRAAIIIGD